MTRLVLINGAPGSGKSTIAERLATDSPSAVVLDLDLLKHSFHGWEEDPTTAGLQARQQFLAVAESHLRDGHDVFLGQFLARVDFIEGLESLARTVSAEFIELVLVLPAAALAKRLDGRAANPTRSEHAINSRLVSSADAPDLVSMIEEVLQLRPTAITVDGTGSIEETVIATRPLI